MAALKEMLDEANSKLNALKDELNQVNRRIEEQAREAKAPARPRPASFYRYDFDDFFDDNNESTTPPPCYETTSIVSDIMADYPFRLVLRKRDLEAEINHQICICDELKRKLYAN